MNLFGKDFSTITAAPLVVRELRVESRKPLNFWLRMLSVAVVVGVMVGFINGSSGVDASQLGRMLFGSLLNILLLTIWIVVPMMTSDCISREKREGTLGLLFLTPLSVMDVMLGKAASHALRAFTLVLASVPVLIFPIVLGGVEWPSILLALAQTLNAMLLGIAAGLYASAKGGSTIQVMVISVLVAMGLAVVSFTGNVLFGWLPNSSVIFFFFKLAFRLGITGYIFVRMLNLSREELKETWDQDSSATERPDWVEGFSGSEFWRGVFRWNTAKALDRNPIAWLQEYSWTARLTKWGWFFGMILTEFIFVVAFPGCQAEIIAVMTMGVSFSAVGSFRRERQNGVLETLLVTPIPVAKLIAGRLWGIFSHFAPALIIVTLFWNTDRILHPHAFEASDLKWVYPNPMTFMCLMVAGLYVSLWRANFFVLWVTTWLVSFVLPAVGAVILGRSEFVSMGWNIGITTGFQICLAAGCLFLLRRNLHERRFLGADAA